VDPQGEIRLHLAHYIRQAMRRPQNGKKMHMIRRSAHSVRHAIHTANGTAKVAVNPFALFHVEPSFAVFRAENEMIVEGDVRRGH
jgi:hypothetical protein